jgi:hypothetical protein
MFESKETAEDVVGVMLRFGGELTRVLGSVEKTEDHKVSHLFRESVAELLSVMLVQIMNPTFNKYPELKPKELG